MNYTVIDADITKPDTDDRKYMMINLTNNLQVLLVSDPLADKSAAALDVHVGSLSDPADIDGLAHFCEHLLFMGTEKYPLENDYSQYLSTHGGMSNAFTSGDHTNYHFEVGSDHLEPALDRFSQFFIAPLFLEECTDREIKAVDSEHKKNIQSDAWRNFQILKDLCDQSHPFSRFGTGCLETLRDIPKLKGIDIRKVLLDFHDQYYSANIMKLVVIGKESLEQLAQWTSEKFSGIANKQIDVPNFPKHPYTSDQLMKIVEIKPVKDIRNISLLFPCADHRNDYKVQPLDYLSHLIGHEGSGSILSLLKAKGWAQSLNAGTSGLGSIGFDFFKVSIELTSDGLDHYEEILQIFFQYVQLMRTQDSISQGFHEVITFKKCQAINRIAFKFKEKSSPSSFATQMAGNMQKYFPKDIISGPYLMEIYDEDLITRCLDYFCPVNLHLTIQSGSFITDGWKRSKWYDSHYRLTDISSELLKKLYEIRPYPELRIPEKNAFIPANFDVPSQKEKIPVSNPNIILDSAVMRIWNKKDDTFLVPKVDVYFEMKTPLAYDSVRGCVLARLYTDLLKDSVNEFAYSADVAGLSFNLDNSTDGILLNVYGYNDKLDILFSKLAHKMATFPIVETVFDRVKDALEKKLKSWYKESPHAHAVYFLSAITQQKLFTVAEKLQVLKDINLKDVRLFYKRLISNCHVEALINGNLTRSEAQNLGDIFHQELQCQPLIDEPMDLKILIIPPGKSVIYTIDAYDQHNLNSAIEYCIQLGSASEIKTRIYAALISQIAQEPGFNQLRTKEQLGYMVFVGVRKQTEMISLRIIIQSEHDPMYLESRIESFLDQMSIVLSTLSLQEYRTHQTSLATRLNTKLKNLGQESARFWSHISSHYYDFHQNSTDSEAMIKVDLNEIRNFYEEKVATVSRKRRKVSVHIRSQSIKCEYNDDQLEIMSNIALNSELVTEENYDAFKASLEVTGEPSPVYPLESWIVK